MDWFLYDIGLRYERVKKVVPLDCDFLLKKRFSFATYYGKHKLQL